jgi:hypothetical protein
LPTGEQCHKTAPARLHYLLQQTSVAGPLLAEQLAQSAGIEEEPA